MTSPPGLDTPQLDLVLESRLWGVRDAPVASGGHPLALWSFRHAIPTSQTLLCEYLASHGYVVAFAWPVDRVPPFPWQEGVTAEEKSAALASQVSLLEAVFEKLRAREWIDVESTAVLSWSYGGESAGALQRRRTEVAIAIGIDSTLASGWIYESVDALAELDGGAIRVPYALLRHGSARVGGEQTAPSDLLPEIGVGAWSVRFPELSHGNFNFTGGMLPGVLGLDEVSEWAVGGETARLGYESICRAVLALLEGSRSGSNEEIRSDLEALGGRVTVEHFPPAG